jgi:hypothetical protein
MGSAPELRLVDGWEIEEIEVIPLADFEEFKERLKQFADDLDSPRRPPDLTAAAVRAVKAQGIHDAIAATEGSRSKSGISDGPGHSVPASPKESITDRGKIDAPPLASEKPREHRHRREQ